MGATILKCPNCGGEITFDPSGQNYRCPYCESTFSQKEIDRLQDMTDESLKTKADEGIHTSSAAFSEKIGSESRTDQEEALVYQCPSCGAEIVTDQTTAATFCYYCHNPVVLSGRLSGEYMPDDVIPFQISREKAIEKFLEYTGKKKFIPKAFFNAQQIEKMTGVYYPYWVYDCEMDAQAEAKATKTRIWRAGDTEFTETSIFAAIRKGDIALKGMSRNALRKTDRQLVENVRPFRFADSKSFSMGYLSGFQAEKRDMEKTEFAEDLQTDAGKYAKNLLSDSITGYNSVTIQHEDYRITSEKWKYTLLPVWVMTYRGLNKTYYYAMNGQTGKIFGELPLDYRKLGFVSAAVFAVVSILGVIGGVLL